MPLGAPQDRIPPKKTPMDAEAALDRKHKLVIIASSLGTVFEWYDFYIYGTLAAFFGRLFFPAGNETRRLPLEPRPLRRRLLGAARSARWSSAGWATWSAASTRS